MSWQPQHGVYATPPGATGVPQMQPGQQSMPAQWPSGGYSVDHLPAPQQTGWNGAPQQPQQPWNGAQPGVPGTQIVQPWNTQQPGQQWGVPTPPGPAPQPGWPQAPGGQPAPQGYAPFPQQPGAVAARVELNDQAILSGPAVPAELQGRTWGDARRLYSALSNDWLQRNRQPQTPAQQTLSAQQPVPQVPTQPAAPAPGGADPRQFWANPEQRIAEIVSQTVSSQMQPMMQRNQQTGILEARQIAATGISDFAYLEPEIMQLVSGATPEYLQKPETWLAAARMARGMKMEQGQYRPTQQAPRAAQVPGQQPSWAPAQPTAPVGSFFTESPSAPSVNGSYGNGGPRAVTQEDQFYAQKWQMPIQDFMAWKYGAAPQPQLMGSY